MVKKLALIALLVLLSATAASAQVPKLETLIPGSDGTAAGRIVQLILVITVLSVAPGLLVMVTCFTRFVVALSFLRAGLGLQTTPANLILISLALFMTFYVMGPTFDQAWQNGVQPLMENKINEQEAFTRISAPFKAFMRANVREKDLKLFEDLAPASRQKAPSQADPAGQPACSARNGSRWQRRRIAGADPGVHDLGAAARLRDRLPDRPAVPGHRPHRGDAHHVDGHDDAAADGYFASLQDFILRFDRWLELAGGLAGPIICLTRSLRVKRYATFFA